MKKALKTTVLLLSLLLVLVMPASALYLPAKEAVLPATAYTAETEADSADSETTGDLPDETAVTEIPSLAAEETDSAEEPASVPENEAGKCEDSEFSGGASEELHPLESAPDLPVTETEKLSPKEKHLLEVLDDSGERENGADIPEEDDSGESENGADAPVVIVPEPKETEPEEQEDVFVYYAGLYKEYDGQYYSIPLSYELQEHAWNMSRKYGVSFEIVMGLMGNETAWLTSIEYSINDGVTYIGLGQICEMYNAAPFAARGINIYTPEGNIEAICSILADKLEEFGGNVHYALMAYNQGSGSAAYCIDCGRESTSYSRSVVSFSENLLTAEEFAAATAQ